MEYREVIKQRLLSIIQGKRRRDAGEYDGTTIPTGLTKLDEHGGIERGVLTVIGAPTGEGKTAFGMHLAEAVATAGLKACVLSFEDPPGKTADRTLAKSTGLDSSRFGRLEDLEIQRLKAAYKELGDWPSRIDYYHGLRTPSECLKIISESGADLVILDYAQAIPEGDRGLERAIADLAWDLSADAQAHNRATIVFSQLRSEVEYRGMRILEASRRRGGALDISGFRPCGVGDLAWSQALGQRAKGLGFIFRPGRYRKRFGEQDPDDRLEILWPKKNFSSEGSIIVGFDAPRSRIYDLPRGNT